MTGRCRIMGVAAAGVASALQRSTVDGGRVDQTIRDILRDPAFASAEGSWVTRLRSAVWQWVLERLTQLFGSAAAPLLAWVLVGIVVAAAGLVTWRATRGMRRGTSAEVDPQLVVTTSKSAKAWRIDAHAAHRRGEHAEAVRCGYRAVIAALANVGAVQEVPGRTVGEYRVQLGTQDPARLADFVRASETFERIWYARRSATDDDVATVLAVADALPESG